MRGAVKLALVSLKLVFNVSLSTLSTPVSTLSTPAEEGAIRERGERRRVHGEQTVQLPYVEVTSNRCRI